MRKFNIFTVFLLVLLIVASFIQPGASAISDPGISAEMVLLVEEKSGTILFEQNKDIRVAPGSISKVMVLLLSVLAVEDKQISLKDNITASDTFLNGLNETAVTEKIKPGETMRFEDLMYCAFLASANDACNILAETIAGSVPGFVSKMNEKAEELGCSDTHFMNPGGLNDPGQYTTVWDQYLIFREAVRHPLFVEIAGAVSYTAAADEDSPERYLSSPNAMLDEKSSYYYQNMIAGKTATSSEYGSSLISYAARNDVSLISVVFGVKAGEGDSSDTVRSFKETKQLFEWGFNSFSWQEVVKRFETAATEKITLAKGTDTIALRPAETIMILARNDLTAADIKKEIIVYGISEGKALSAPVKDGDVLGEMTVSVDGTVCGKVGLVAAQSVELDRAAYIKSQISDTLSEFWVQFGLFVLLVLAGLYIWVVIRDRKKRRMRQLRIEEARRKIVQERQRQKINR